MIKFDTIYSKGLVNKAINQKHAEYCCKIRNGPLEVKVVVHIKSRPSCMQHVQKKPIWIIMTLLLVVLVKCNQHFWTANFWVLMFFKFVCGWSIIIVPHSQQWIRKVQFHQFYFVIHRFVQFYDKKLILHNSVNCL